MTLFATLAAAASSTAAAEDRPEASDPPPASSPSAPPTAVQLYTSKSIDFLTGAVVSDLPPDPNDASAAAAAAADMASPPVTPRSVDSSSAAAGGGGVSERRRFEVLSYQAVEIGDSPPGSAPGEGAAVRLPGALVRQQRQARRHARPNLGVWDCHLSVGGGGGAGGGGAGAGNGELVDRLLAGIVPGGSGGGGKSHPTFLFAVDLSNPSGVYPAVNAMIGSVLRRCDAAAAEADGDGDGGGEAANRPPPPSAGATTRTSKLRAAGFGTAPEKLSSGDRAAPAPAADPPSGDARLGLVVCCVVPPRPTAARPQTFRDKQALGLVLYHLHRLACEADCTLAFVRPDGSGEAEAGEEAGGEGGADPSAAAGAGAPAMPSLKVSELAAAVRRVAAGYAPVEAAEGTGAPKEPAEEKKEGQEGEGGEENLAEGEGEEEEAPAAADPAKDVQPPVYPPGSHDADLINSVLLRNASCPGEWDAAKDDLWIALPPKGGGPGGDGAASKSAPAGGGPSAGGIRGDENWLSKLAESVSISTAGGADEATVATAASGKSKGSKKKPTKKAKPPKQGEKKSEDAKAFFANLLNK